MDDPAAELLAGLLADVEAAALVLVLALGASEFDELEQATALERTSAAETLANATLLRPRLGWKLDIDRLLFDCVMIVSVGKQDASGKHDSSEARPETPPAHQSAGTSFTTLL